MSMIWTSIGLLVIVLQYKHVYMLSPSVSYSIIHKGEYMLCYCVVGRISSYVCACMSSLMHSGVSHASTYYAVAHREYEGRTQGGCCCLVEPNPTQSNELNQVRPHQPLIEGGWVYLIPPTSILQIFLKLFALTCVKTIVNTNYLMLNFN